MRTKLCCIAATVAVLIAFAQPLLAPDSPPVPRLVINEVAWAGSAADYTAEWIELFNPSDSPIDLDGWRLLSSDGAPNIQLSGVIGASVPGDTTAGYFLLERGSDDSVPSRTADLCYEGALSNLGETLMLVDPQGRVVDTANAPIGNLPLSGWPAGSSVTFASMERVDVTLPDAPANWTSAIVPETDALQTPPQILGTPARENWAYNVPPVIQLSIEPSILQPGHVAVFSAAGTHDANDPIVLYAWTFGDGTSAEGQEVLHVYNLAGSYTLTLTVTDAKGGTSQVARELSVHFAYPPIADFSVILPASEDVARARMPLSFHDESSDEDSAIVSREWTFGDGSKATGTSVTHEYAKAGQYEVALTVTDAQGETATYIHDLLVQSQAPVLSFAMDTEAPNSGEPIVFDASSSYDPDGQILSYVWDFDGDGITDLETTAEQVECTYTQGGSYVLRLTGIDDEGQRASLERAIDVNASPIAQFQMPETIRELDRVALSDRSQDVDGTIVRWSWHFGDGVLSASPSPTHIYRQNGEFTISLTVTDDQGATDSATAIVQVENLPPRAVLAPPPPPSPTGQFLTFDASHSFDLSPTGEIVRYEWDLYGQQTFEQETTTPTIRHSYADNGNYSIRVRVTDSDGAQGVSMPLSITVLNRPPQATRIAWTPSSPQDGEEVVFTAQGQDPDGELRGWIWQIESSSVSSAETFTHIFQDDGPFTVSLQVRDDDGATSPPITATVEVANAAPVARFSSVQDTSCDAGSVRFDASASYDPSPTGRIVHIAWDFGDATSCPGTAPDCTPSGHWNPVHCYSEPGTYIVTLTVIDEQGAIGTITRTIQIAE